MEFYLFDESTKELFQTTLQEQEYIDPTQLYDIPENAVVADAELPALSQNQAYIVSGEKSGPYFTVSENVAVIEDHKGETVYGTADGSAVEIKDLGPLPADVTTEPRPDAYHEWNGSMWAEKENAAALRLADARAAMPALTPKQLKLALALNNISEEKVQTAINAIEDEKTKLIAQYEWTYALSFKRINERTEMLAALVGLNAEQVDALWQTAATL